jgi:hypothetical protein
MQTMPRPHRSRRAGRYGPALTAALVVFVVVLVRTEHRAGRPSGPSAPATTQPGRATSGPAQATSSQRTNSQAHTTAAPRYAAARLHRIVERYDPGSISVAAYDVDTGRLITAGARRGMITASLIKVELLETLLLRHQRSGTPLAYEERAECQEMIENSDNDAADSIYWDDDAGVGLDGAERPLGLSPERTKPRGDDYWGLSTTSAAEQIALLKDLVLPTSPLLPTSRRFALHLFENVEADQRWGVPSVADKGSTYAVKNGWLPIDDDDDLWAVTSDGVVQVGGHTVLMSVMTQHDLSMGDGVDLVERLARLAAEALRQGSVR